MQLRVAGQHGFLVAGFRGERWYWELWNTFRKAVFSAFAVLLRPVGVEMQTWAALGLLFLDRFMS